MGYARLNLLSKMNEKQLKKYITKKYSINTIVKVSKPNSQNINSENYYILTPKGKFVFHKIHDNSKKIESMCKVLTFCVKKNIKVQEPIKTIENKFSGKNSTFLTKYYEGGIFKGNSIQIKNISRNLAELHLALKKCKISYNYMPNQKFYKILSEYQFKSIKNKIRKKNKLDIYDILVQKNFKILNSQFLSYTDIFSTKLKKQLIHADLHPENVIFLKNNVNAIIDFISMKKGNVMEDISFSSFRFAIYKTTNLAKIADLIKLFITNYLKINHIELSELKNIKLFLNKKILERISFLLNKHYFYDSNLWIMDLKKYITFLKIINSKNFSLNKIYN